MYKENIRIGTLVGGGANTGNYIRQILGHGFESFEINFWQTLGDTDLKKLASEVKDAIGSNDVVIAALGVYGNPLKGDAKAKETIEGWKKLVDQAHLFGCSVVTGFAGRVVDKPIPESIPAYKKVFGPIAKRAKDKGVKLAFENCEMGGDWHRGDWNMAQTPDAWEMMFDAIPLDNIGLEWEPCHQMVKLIDPMPQIRKYGKRMFHIHGKDATILRDVIEEHGIKGPVPWCFHRTPGFGDSNWTDIISELRRVGFVGSIDIEGWHDPVYRGELEMMGQVTGMQYLKRCRGTYAENPK